jgi:molybdate transport system ATP-binding protein
VLEIDLRLPLGRFDLAMEWRTGETSLSLFGPSGSGKTTLLETIAGLRNGARGIVRVAGLAWLDSARGVALPPEERGVGYVPQESLLFPHLDVMGNILAGRRRATGRRGALDPRRVLAVLELDGLERRSVAGLSGGEKRRVALARALCSAPDLLLLDEPLAALDAPLRDRILGYLLRVRDEFRIPTIHVSHDVTECRLLGREVALVEEGRVVRTGPADEVFLEREAFRAALAAGFENILDGRVAAIEEGAARIEIEPETAILAPGHGLAAGDLVRVGLRAEDLILAVEPPRGLSAQNVVRGIVREVREEDEPVLVVVAVGGAAPLAATITRQALRRLAPAPGREVFLVWKANACRVWGARSV